MMKELRHKLVVAAILNLLLTFGCMGLISEGTLAESSVLTTSSIMDSSPQAQLRFSSGGSLETPAVKNYKQYSTEMIFAEKWDFRKFPPVPENLIPGAVISIEGDITKAIRTYKDRGNGKYDIEITPTQTGRLYFKINASKDGYGTSSVEIILSVEQTPSDLLFLSNNQPIETGDVEFYSMYTTYVNFTSDSGPINGASIGIASHFTWYEFNWSSTYPGVYCVNISLTEIGKEVYTIWASVGGVATSSVDLILTSTPFQTALRFTSNNILRETNQGRERVNINQTYTTEVQFNRTSTTPETPIDNATLNLFSSDPGIAHTVIPLKNGLYQIVVSANESKKYNIVIEASKPVFSNASATLTLEVSLIPASLEVMNPDFKENELHVTYTDPINVTVRFQDENGPLAWDNYTIDSGGLNFHSLALGDELGQYILLFNASSLAPYNVKLNATATGHETAVLNIMVSADPIPMVYELYIKNGEIQGSVINIDEGRPAKITLTLRELHVPSHPRYNDSIKGAHVEYSLEEGRREAMKDQGNGTYTMDLSGEGLDTGTPYQFNIIATKEHDFKRLEITYSVVIKPKPPSPIEQWLYTNWYIPIGGTITSFGLIGYIFRRRQQYRKELALFEERKRSCYELVSDILSFQDLLIISADGSLIYGFRASTVDGVSEESLHSAFMMALKTFAGESIMLDELKGEDHFRFGETEIFLVSGDMATFAFLYEAQMKDEEWRRVSTEMLERCRESVAAIEFEFQEALQGYQISHDSALIPKKKITRRISGILELEVGMAHKLTGKKLQIDEPYLPNKKAILDSVQQLEEKRDAITLTTLLESLVDLGVPTDEAVFIFYQLQVGEMIRPKE